MFDPQREICSGVFSSLENPYRKLNSFLSGKAMRAALKLQELNSASGETQVRPLCAAVRAPCRYPLGVRLPVIPPRCLYLQNLFLLGTSVAPTSTEKERIIGQCFTWQTLLIDFQWKKTWGGYSVPSPTYWLRPSMAPASIWGWCVLTGKPGEPKIFPGYCFIAP